MGPSKVQGRPQKHSEDACSLSKAGKDSAQGKLGAAPQGKIVSFPVYNHQRPEGTSILLWLHL
jgi:hypothetical protein